MNKDYYHNVQSPTQEYWGVGGTRQINGVGLGLQTS